MASLLQVASDLDDIDQRSIVIGLSGAKQVNTNPTFTLSEIGAATEGTLVGYAIKLATARTINGTSFDGTAAITTNTWGLPQTWTVAGVARSIDGSANVDFGNLTIEGIERHVILNSGWSGSAGVGATYSFTLPTGWEFGEFRCCAIFSNNSTGRYYMEWLPWSDMSSNLDGSFRSSILSSLNTNTTAAFGRTGARTAKVYASSGTYRIIKVWLERVISN